ncbi:MAG TPA: type II secretion system F family protein [Streptosporangiaceae bacterium]|nr:type II secretion system F family protein [Streptosporangiaceae bacterium]
MGGPMMLAAALAGALVMTGIAVLVAELTRKAPPPGTPTSLRLSLGRMTGPARRRALLSILVGIVMLGVTRWPVAALAAAAAVIFVPKMTASRATRRHAALLEGLEQWTRRLADMLTASRGLEDALEVSARTAPAVIAGPVTALARRLSARVGTEEALRAFAAEIGDPAGDRIAAALIIATGKRGGGVHGVLSALAEILARDVAARREIEADRAQHRATIRWIVVFISGFTLFAIVNRSYSAPYGTVLGEAVLAFVALLYTAGLAWLHRLGTIPAPGRFLDQTPARIAPAGTAPAGMVSGSGDPYLARGGPDGSGVTGFGSAGFGSAGFGSAGFGSVGYDFDRTGPAGYGPGGGVFDSGLAGSGLPGAGLPGAGLPRSGPPGSGPPGSGARGPGTRGSGAPGSGEPGSGAPGLEARGSGTPGMNSWRRNWPGSAPWAGSPRWGRARSRGGPSKHRSSSRDSRSPGSGSPGHGSRGPGSPDSGLAEAGPPVSGWRAPDPADVGPTGTGAWQSGAASSGYRDSGFAEANPWEPSSWERDPTAPGTAGSGPAGSGTAGSGTAGPGIAGPGTGGSGTAGSGTAGSGGLGALRPLIPDLGSQDNGVLGNGSGNGRHHGTLGGDW